MTYHSSTLFYGIVQVISVSRGRFPRASAKPPRPLALPAGSRLSRFSRRSRRLQLQSQLNMFTFN
jgi:hypothetical protein